VIPKNPKINDKKIEFGECMNWMYYLGHWWRIVKFEENSVFILFPEFGASSLMVSELTLRDIMKSYWGFKSSLV